MAGRGARFASFVGVEAFLALMITAVHGYSTAVTGAVIATGSISWAVGAWLESKLDESHPDQRPLRMFVGSSLVTIGIAAQLTVLFVTSFPLFIVVAGWIVVGLGIGMAHSTASVLAFALAPAGEEGRVSAALQISDQFLAALSTGVCGALLALATRLERGEQYGILLAHCFVVLLALVAVTASWRLARSRRTNATASEQAGRTAASPAGTGDAGGSSAYSRTWAITVAWWSGTSGRRRTSWGSGTSAAFACCSIVSQPVGASPCLWKRGPDLKLP